jgi:cell division protein FtsI (penicillin-binding protein 3)
LFTENPDGNELRLTVDSDIQYNLESELANAVTTFDADHAVGVVLDAKTSAIVALASAPTFDVNKAAKASADYRRNKVVTDAFEPGSTMKTFAIAAALRENVVQPNTKFFCEYGAFKVGDRIIKEAETKEKFGDMTVAQILALSSNVGTTKIAFKMGQDKLRQGLLDFGFGQKLGVDLPGESRGMVQALPWRQHLLSNISFGHGVSSTPLQMANAYAAIANGGVLNTPYIVESVRDSETGLLTETQVKPIRRVLTPEQAAQMRAMLVGVTTPGFGSGGNARVEGFMVGGKTGTAQKVDPNGRGYIRGAYVSSFAGFIPANDPRFVIYIAVDSPRKSYYGATVAAPIFSRVASYAVRKVGIAPLPLAADKVPAKSRKLAALEKILDKVDTTPMEENTVPDLMKLSTREVLRRVRGQEINVKFVGQGLVSEVVPASGSALPEDKNITVILR